MSGKRKTGMREFGRVSLQPSNLKFTSTRTVACTHHIPVNSGPTFALWPITWDRSHPKVKAQSVFRFNSHHSFTPSLIII
jgi:hypothetical protein